MNYVGLLEMQVKPTADEPCTDPPCVVSLRPVTERGGKMKKLLILVLMVVMFVMTTSGVASALIHPIVSADECASATGAAAGNPADPPGVFPSGFQWENADAQAFAHGNSGGLSCQSP